MFAFAFARCEGALNCYYDNELSGCYGYRWETGVP